MNRLSQLVVMVDSASWLSVIEYSLNSRAGNCQMLQARGLSQWLKQLELSPSAIAVIEISNLNDSQLEQLQTASRGVRQQSDGSIWVAVGELRGVADAGFALKTLLCFGFDLYCRDQNAWTREFPRLLQASWKTAWRRNRESTSRATIESELLERLPRSDTDLWV